jgi:hypothetical protein
MPNSGPWKERPTAAGDLRHTQNASVKSDKKKETKKRSSISKRINSFWSKNTSDESLQKEVNNMTTDISDSAFLGELGIQDDQAMVLDHASLSSLIDLTVSAMTHTVLKMQQEEQTKRVEREVEFDERKALAGILVDFIRGINSSSTASGLRTS